MSAPAADTIAAIATARGRGGVGILRLSGPQAGTIAECIAGPMPPPRQAQLRAFRDVHGEVLDHGLLLWFAAPASYTGEKRRRTAGARRAGVNAGTAADSLHPRRPHRPSGEFSERAFLNGRIDLAQAEAVADLIDAASIEAARAARRSLDGEFSQRIDRLAAEIIALRVHVEGALDFSDEDVDWLSEASLRPRLEALREDLELLLTQAGRGRRLTEGLSIAIAGRPNVGKSTLLNRLAGADAAIVTDQPGTTRDLLREQLVIDGLPVTVTDTAGLRDTDDAIEREGIRRAWSAIEGADALLYLIDDRLGVTEEDARLLARLPASVPQLRVRNKCDLTAHKPQRLDEDGEICIRLAAGPDLGVQLLRDELRRLAGLDGGSEGVFSARTRHLEALRLALGHLRAVPALLQSGAPAELAAEELRLAHQALTSITGLSPAKICWVVSSRNSASAITRLVMVQVTGTARIG